MMEEPGRKLITHYSATQRSWSGGAALFAFIQPISFRQINKVNFSSCFSNCLWLLMEQEDIITVIRLILSITKTIAEIIDEFDEMIMKSNESI